MSKRVRVDENEDCLLLPYRDNAIMWKKGFDIDFEGLNPLPHFEEGLQKSRCFVGWLLNYESYERRYYSPNRCCIEIRKLDFKIVYRVVEHSRILNYYDTIEECFTYIEEKGLITLDRGKTPYFAPAAARLARLALNAWCIFANRMGVPRDLRRLIGEKYLWPERHVWIP